MLISFATLKVCITKNQKFKLKIVQPYVAIQISGPENSFYVIFGIKFYYFLLKNIYFRVELMVS